jgi:hypothetical protein
MKLAKRELERPGRFRVAGCYHLGVLRSVTPFAFSLALASAGLAQLEPSPDGTELDPLVFAERVRARGDEPILEALLDPSTHGRSARRRAIRAATELRDPAAALPALAEIAASREPFDSVAAMHAILEIVRAMPGDAVERFELDRDALVRVVDALRRLAGDESALITLRAVAGTAAAELSDRLG